MRQSKFQFVNPYLEELCFSENANYNIEKEVALQNSFNVRIDRFENDDSAKVTLSLEIKNDNDDKPFSLSLRISSIFNWEGLEEEEVKKMLNYNAPALLLSYMRPIVSSITNFSRFPAYNLPFFNFLDNKNSEC